MSAFVPGIDAVGEVAGDPARAGAPGVVLAAHGSSDPRAAETTRALARMVSAARPGLAVRVSFLDHTSPRPDEVLAELADDGYTGAVVVPLLLTAAYHVKVDLPAVLRAAALPVRVTEVLGPVGGVVPAPLLAAVRRRLHQAGGARADAVVLAAAGTRDAAARVTVQQAARALGALLGVPCGAGYASAAGPTPGEATIGLLSAGAERVALAAYFVAPGRLYRQAVDSARAAGALFAAAPLGASGELARLVLDRIDRSAANGRLGGGTVAERVGRTAVCAAPSR